VARLRWLIPLGLLLVALIGASCASDDDDASSSGQAPAAAEGQTVKAVPLQAQADPRSVIYTANLVVRVTDVGEASSAAVARVDEAGGFLFKQDSDLEGEQSTTLTVKVPPERYQAVLADLGALGEVLTRQVRTQDVTDQVVDLEGRLASAQASRDRLRALFDQAQSTSDIIAIEAELVKRESEVESLQGQLQVLNNQVDMATITLRLTVEREPDVSDELPGFLESLRNGWVALINVLLVMAAVIGFVLPFLPIPLLVWWLVRRYLRSHPRSDRPSTPNPPTWPLPGVAPQHPGAPPSAPPPPATS